MIACCSGSLLNFDMYVVYSSFLLGCTDNTFRAMFLLFRSNVLKSGDPAGNVMAFLL